MKTRVKHLQLKPLRELTAEQLARKKERASELQKAWGATLEKYEKEKQKEKEWIAQNSKASKKTKLTRRARKKQAKGRRYHGDNYKQYNRQIKAYPKSEQKIYKGELMMRDLLDTFFPGAAHINNHRPLWLVNPKTGALLELDRFYPDLKLAFEYQGDQHYEYCPEFHENQDAFNRQVERDSVKRKTCKAQGVFLCYVHANDLSVEGMETLLDGLERCKTSGQFWIGRRKVRSVRKTKDRKETPRYAKQLRAVKSGVIGSKT